MGSVLLNLPYSTQHDNLSPLPANGEFHFLLTEIALCRHRHVQPCFDGIRSLLYLGYLTVNPAAVNKDVQIGRLFSESHRPTSMWNKHWSIRTPKAEPI